MQLVNQGLLTQYHDDGDRQAPVVVLLHGWGAASPSFDGLAARLAKTYRVIRLDLPGFGGTQLPAADWDVLAYAAFVSEFLQKLEVTAVEAAIGHSFGGRIAIKGQSQGLLAAGKLVLLDSAGVKPSKSLIAHGYKAVAKGGKAVLRLPVLSRFAATARRRLYQSAGSTDYLNSGELRQIFLKVINEDLRADAGHIQAPTLLIWGADDHDTPPADGHTLAGIIPHSTLHVVAGAGHFVYLDAPDRVADLILDFLK